MLSRKWMEMPIQVHPNLYQSDIYNHLNPTALYQQSPYNLNLVSNQPFSCQNNLSILDPIYYSTITYNPLINQRIFSTCHEVNPASGLDQENIRAIHENPQNHFSSYYSPFYDFSSFHNDAESPQLFKPNDYQELIHNQINCDKEKIIDQNNINEKSDESNQFLQNKINEILPDVKIKKLKKNLNFDENLNSKDRRHIKKVDEGKYKDYIFPIKKQISKGKSHLNQLKIKKSKNIILDKRPNAILLKRKSQLKNSENLNKKEDEINNMEELFKLEPFSKRPVGKKQKSQIASTKYRVNGKFVSKEMALKILGPNINRIAEHPLIHQTLNLSLGFALSAEIH